MSREALTNLGMDIHAALRLWHKGNTGDSPISHLYVYQQAQAKTGNARQATNQVLLTALQTLESRQGQLAHLLRLRFLDQVKMRTIANQLNIAEGTAYKQQKQAILYLAGVVADQEQHARQTRQSALGEALNLPPENPLIGIDRALKALKGRLDAPGPPWLISIEGLGGIGKTSLANALLRTLILDDRFRAFAWVSAKQEEFHPALGIQALDQPALDEETLVTALLAQLNDGISPAISLTAKLAALNDRLKAAPHFIVIDNLETVLDYETLLPTLRRLANPSRFLLTSRHSLQAHPDIGCHRLTSLSRADTIALLRQEAGVRGLSSLAEAGEEQLIRIYETVGGNPLALKLVVGQIGVLPLSQVLQGLREAQEKRVDALYTYIYWQTWHTLDEASRHLLLAMPLAQDGDLEQLAAVTKLPSADLSEALQKLIARSLVNVYGSLEARTYRIHRLTETFLLTEVSQW